MALCSKIAIFSQMKISKNDNIINNDIMDVHTRCDVEQIYWALDVSCHN